MPTVTERDADAIRHHVNSSLSLEEWVRIAWYEMVDFMRKYWMRTVQCDCNRWDINEYLNIKSKNQKTGNSMFYCISNSTDDDDAMASVRRIH